MTHKAGNDLYAAGTGISWVKIGAIVLFSKCKLTSISGEEIENTEIAPLACLIYKLFKSIKVDDDFQIGSHRDIQTREQALFTFESTKEYYPVRFCLEVFLISLSIKKTSY